MSLDLENELRLAMHEFADEVQAPPDLLARLPRRRTRGLPRVAVAAAAAAAVTVVAGVLYVSDHTGGSDGGTTARPLSTYHVDRNVAQQDQLAAREMTRAIEHWGPTRGDRADDQQLMTRLRAEWAHPTQHPADLGSFGPVQSPDGPVKILWAGTTPDGVAAYAVQHTKDPVADYWFGIFLPGSDGQPYLADRSQLMAGADLGEFDVHLMSFTTSTAHHAVVVIPTDAQDGVRVAFRTVAGPQGKLSPQWQDVPVRDGAAVASVTPGGNVWGSVVEVTHAGRVVADHSLDFVATHLINEGPPQPANLLPMWCNGCSIGTSGPGYGKAMLTAWLVRHGPDYLRAYTSMWSVGGSLPDGTSVLAMQLWVVGHPARTVVLLDDQQKSQVDVLYDAETKPADRPVVAVRLPSGNGWLVGAGPNAVITGWRAAGGSGWHPTANKTYLLVPTDATSIELRLRTNGRQQVVTE